jgi:hypothetical protein
VKLSLEQSEIGKRYNKINPRRSVLLSDCCSASPWCNDPAFRFEAVFAEAAKIARPGSPEPVAQQWQKAMMGADPEVSFLPFRNLAELNSRLQLLAITNRLDLAAIRGRMRTGAEVHFEYGYYSEDHSPDVFLILEFRLPDMQMEDFAALAQRWIDLSSSSDADYVPALRRVLALSGFFGGTGPGRLARVSTRVNREIRAGVWRISQVVLNRASANPTEFAAVGLDNQLDSTFEPDAFGRLWNKGEQALASRSDYDIPNGFWTRQSSLEYRTQSGADNKPCSLGTPGGEGGNAAAKLRNVLAIQQCTLCHTSESGTLFRQISNRAPGESSTLSSFLAGTGGTNPHPALLELYYAEAYPEVVRPVVVNYGDYSGNCSDNKENPRTETRYYHDIARRALFLAEAPGETRGTTGQHFRTRLIH